MQTQRRPIADLRPNPDNPRVIKDDKFRKLVESVRQFPQMLELRPIVVRDDLTVLGGNMRLQACKEAGLKDVPVVIASDLTPEQQREFIVKDNVAFGEWNWDTLANEWDAEQLTAWGLDGATAVNFTPASIDEQTKPNEKTVERCPSCGEQLS